VNEPGCLVWTEYMAREYDEAKEFFAAIFSYTYRELGDDDFQYSMIEVDGSTVGGLGVLSPEMPAGVTPHFRIYFAVDNCDEAAQQVVQLGGAVLRPPQDMPYGRHADVADPQGAAFSIITPPSGQ
jgi:predicted enzyme related to lactoylglutathione lyase